uniref:PCI domain-containing protein n=2 Tax=Rhizochromulina marina TaxID=1034831 RepID=A0A7S2WC72_9STRA|mmetsp:Transcript_19711/g.57544  ORF Transcript_19711/g.57544 Transcript_19711/m.57544 type:complete len:182 (+) Transcript_19711:368-913(+)
MSQLKPFYSNPSSSARPLRCAMLGLNLMNLLVENRLAEFHSEVELLTEAERASPAVAFPMQIEEHLMMGSYNRVLMARKSIPAPTFELFMELVTDTVRTSIAECAEVSYSKLSVAAAMEMMMFDSPDKLQDFVQESFATWTISNGIITFRPTALNARSEEVPSTRLIKETIAYATELERIV